MSQSNYEALCTALDKLENIKANMKNLFVERFARFIGCPNDHIDFTITSTSADTNCVNCVCDIGINIVTKQFTKSVCVSGVVFDNYPEKNTTLILFADISADISADNGVDNGVDIGVDPTRVFTAILVKLHESLIRESLE